MDGMDGWDGWMVWMDGMDRWIDGWDWMVIIGHRSSKSTFGANKQVKNGRTLFGFLTLQVDLQKKRMTIAYWLEVIVEGSFLSFLKLFLVRSIDIFQCQEIDSKKVFALAGRFVLAKTKSYDMSFQVGLEKYVFAMKELRRMFCLGALN